MNIFYLIPSGALALRPSHDNSSYMKSTGAEGILVPSGRSAATALFETESSNN